MMAMKAARGYTGRPKIAKFEGFYHGTYDPAEVSVNPPLASVGDADIDEIFETHLKGGRLVERLAMALSR